ncbi:PUA-like domain-containing protein [Microdochium bolleyi]|uniref:PUA-like domain-containing protein n=1 Tax=Microdochium bolleyi TaxID=196109 RepID=A0A136J9L1_9PEZI|nr:PUA-like domain-containing protein [Microdochium bolleyi]
MAGIEVPEAPQKVNLLVVPKSGPGRINVLKKENKNLILMAMKSTKTQLPKEAEEYDKRLKDARVYLAWLDYSTDLSRGDIDISGWKNTVEKLLSTKNSLPEDIIDRATELKEKFEQTTVTEDVDQDEDQSADSGEDDDLATGSQTVAGTAMTELALPPANHPIFGRDGIMHGVITGRGKNNRIVRRLNPLLQRKKTTVYGHNGIPVGAWFPLQLVALFNGAHGSAMGGIHGDTQLGAYSIVIANTYDDLDTDDGDMIYYSGSNSHKNTDPKRPAESTNGTQALKASFRTQNPVRVLRSGGSSAVAKRSRNSYLPEAGIRYDGLYRVVNMRTPKNRNGGMYEQFRLERLPEQPTLAEIRETSPTQQQLRDLREIQRGY